MTGPEHYRLAEKGVAMCEEEPAETVRLLLAEAQVHATLALAAATALAVPVEENGPMVEAWHRAGAWAVSS